MARPSCPPDKVPVVNLKLVKERDIEMAKKLEVYKCEHCGIMVETIHDGGGKLICCDDEMKLLSANTTDAAQEKHVPVVEKVEGGYKVVVGSVAHPMTEDHLIEWIELLADGVAYRQFLTTGSTPEAIFQVEAKEVQARAYCNLHGLWKA